MEIDCPTENSTPLDPLSIGFPHTPRKSHRRAGADARKNSLMVPADRLDHSATPGGQAITATSADITSEKEDDLQSAAPPAPFADVRLSSLPALRSPLTPAQILAALDRLARRGKLPGYEPLGALGFKVALFGEPFDRDLIATLMVADDATRLTFRARLQRKAPAVLFGSVALSIWPGVLIMDTIIPGSWGWWPTWTWYLPMTILPLPIVLPGMLKKSNASARIHLREQLERIARAISADPA